MQDIMAKKKTETETVKATEEGKQSAAAVRFPIAKDGRYVCSDGARFIDPHSANVHENKLKPKN